MLSYVQGDATQPIGDGPKIIAHITNNRGGWGAGFVVAISRRWSAPERAYRRSPEAGRLGQVQLVRVTETTWIANMCAQDGYPSSQRRTVVDYAALGLCLDELRAAAETMRASVHCPRIGCGLGGGSWEAVESLLLSRLVTHGISVTVYDLKQQLAG